MSSTNTSISCSVVSGSDQEAIVGFLRSFAVAASNVQGAKITVTAIINDGDEDLARRVAPLANEVVTRTFPVGFAANHNEFLRKTTSEFHIIANDDVVVDRNCLRDLLEVARTPSHADAAVISPLLRNPDGSLQPSTASFPTLTTAVLIYSGLRSVIPPRLEAYMARWLRSGAGSSKHWDHDTEVSVQTLRGAFVLVRMDAVREVGYMSEIALVGGEEAEWHARLESVGWKVLFTPRAEVIHVGRVSTGGRPDLDVEYVKGMVNYFAQHGSKRSFFVVKTCGQLHVAYLRLRALITTGSDLKRYGRPVRAIEFRGTDLATISRAHRPE